MYKRVKNLRISLSVSSKVKKLESSRIIVAFSNVYIYIRQNFSEMCSQRFKDKWRLRRDYTKTGYSHLTVKLSRGPK